MYDVPVSVMLRNAAQIRDRGSTAKLCEREKVEDRSKTCIPATDN